MADPFDFPDPFDLGGGRRRVAQFPALPEAEARSAIGTLTDGTLSGLSYVGSLLDKMTGARAIKGVLGGHPREALSLLPFSDSFGITDPTQITSGEQLLEGYGLIGPNDPTRWEFRDFAGPAAEIALDPATWLGGIGALTAAGKAAQKTGTLSKGLLAGVAAGERRIHPLMAWASPATQAAAGELPGQAASLLNVGVRKLPGVGPAAGAAIDYGGQVAGAAKVGVRSLFDPLAGPFPDATVQAAHESALLPRRRAVLQGLEGVADSGVRGPVLDLYRDIDALHAAGADPAELDRYIRQGVEGVEPSLRRGGAPGPHLGTLGPHLAEIDPVVDRFRELYPRWRADELAMGDRSPALKSLWGLDYGLRQVSRASGGGAGGLAAKLMDTSSPSARKRLSIFDLPGGTEQVNDVIRDPAFSLAARTPAGRAAVGSKVWDLLTEGAGVGPLGTPLSPETLARMETIRKRLPAYLARVPDEFIDIPGRATPAVPFFKPDVAANLLLRGERSAAMQAGAAGVYDVAGRAGVPASGPGLTPVLRLLRQAGLQGEASREHTLRALGLDPAELMRQAAAATTIPMATPSPMSVYGKALKPFSVPDRAAAGATKLMTRFAAPAEVAPAVKWLDSGMAWLKDLLYTGWPSSHVRNAYSGLGEAAIEGGVGPTNPAYRDYARALAGDGLVAGLPGYGPLSPDAQRYQLLRDLYVRGTVDPLRPQGELNQAVGLRVPDPATANPVAPLGGKAGARAILKDWTNVPGAVRDPFGMRGVSGTGRDWFDLAGKGPRAADTNPMVRAGRATGRATENWLRGAESLALQRKGWTPAAAHDAVMATHLDYTDGLSDFEKNVMRRLVPFYTFSRLNIPKQVRRAVERPATVQVPLRGAATLKDEETYTPDYLSSGLAIPLGTRDDGTTRFLSQVGLPFEEAFGHLKVGRNAADTATRTLTNLASSLRGIVRLPLEQVAGKQFYTGRDLADLRPGNLATGFGLFSDDTARPLAQLLSNSPATRFASTAERLMDPRKWQDPFVLPLSLATGAKLTDVDTAKWRAIDARDQLERELAAMPHVGESRDFYARPDQKAALSDEERYALRLEAYIKEKAREAAKAKRQQVGVQVGGG